MLARMPSSLTHHSPRGWRLGPPTPMYETAHRNARPRAVFTLNRPEKMNAWNDGLMTDLKDAITKANADEEISAIVVTGAGRAYCSGADIGGWANSMAGSTAPRGSATAGEDNWLAFLRRNPKPAIAAINGGDRHWHHDGAADGYPHRQRERPSWLRLREDGPCAGTREFVLPLAARGHRAGARMEPHGAHGLRRGGTRLWSRDRGPAPESAVDRAVEIGEMLAAQPPSAILRVRRCSARTRPSRTR